MGEDSLPPPRISNNQDPLGDFARGGIENAGKFLGLGGLLSSAGLYPTALSPGRIADLSAVALEKAGLDSTHPYWGNTQWYPGREISQAASTRNFWRYALPQGTASGTAALGPLDLTWNAMMQANPEIAKTILNWSNPQIPGMPGMNPYQ